MRHHEFFLLVGYEASKKAVVICEIIRDCLVADVETRVSTHLEVDPDTLPHILASSDIFKPPYPLVRAIHRSRKKGDLLVLSPSQELHAEPLHALPHASVDDSPLID